MPFRIKLSLAFLLTVLGLLAIIPFLIPIPPLENTVTEDALADSDSQFITLNDLRVHYKTSELNPKDPDLNFLLLHGFGSYSYSWHKVLEPLAAMGNVIAFDRPAFGLTQRPTREEWTVNPYTFPAQIDLILSLMDEFAMEDAILIGNSAGGTIATHFALQHPDRVRGLVLVDAAIYQGGSTPLWAKPLLYSPQMNRLGPLLMRQIAEGPGLNMLQSAWSDPDELDEQTLEAYQKPLNANNWDKALWEYSRASRKPRLANKVSTITQPVLVITGQDDRIVPAELSERLADDLGVEAQIFEGCGHVPQEECPEVFLQSVDAWLIKEQLVENTTP